MTNMLDVHVLHAIPPGERLSFLMMNAKKQRRITKKIGMRIRKQARVNTQRQQDIDGKSFADRKDRKNRKKMLKRIALAKHMKIVGTSNGAEIRFKNKLMGKIARLHQDGIDEVQTAQEVSRKRGKPNYSDPATRAIAKQLKEYGFKRRAENGRYVKASIRWITDNMSIGQAGLVLRILKGEKDKRRWIIPGTKRAFLGVNRKMIAEMYDDVLQELGEKA